jgi:hypothetical protein
MLLQDIEVWQPSAAPQVIAGDNSFQIIALEGGRCRVHHSTFHDVAEAIAQKLQVCH